MTSATSQIAGVVLAGGRARRMGGRNKAFIEVAGRRMIDHVLARLCPQVVATAISVNDDLAQWQEFGLPLLPDSFPDRPGPLAGILAGLDWAAAEGFTAIVTVATDTPFFPRDLVSHLCAARGTNGVTLAASPDRAGRLQQHPVFGLWPVRLRENLRDSLKAGTRRAGQWARLHDAGQTDFSGPEDPFFNINTPDDLRRAGEVAARLA
ncbi:MAG: molybdenum cofactor guanylyltransferase MobA [Pseudorhodobacter sp.]